VRREGSEGDDRLEGMAEAPAPVEADESAAQKQEHLRELQRVRQARVAKVAVVLAIVIILMIFIIANSQGVLVHFVFFSRRPPLIWVMFACAVLGGIAGYLIGKPGKQIRLRRGPKEERKK
jgi:uncharacterized integral membrane protein